MTQDQPTGDKTLATPSRRMFPDPSSASLAFGDSNLQEDREKTPEAEATEEERREMAEYAMFRRFTKLREQEKQRQQKGKSVSGVEKSLSFSSEEEEEDVDEFIYIEDPSAK